MKILLVLIICLAFSNASLAGPANKSGRITSLLASATDPAIRLEGNVSPEACNGGKYGWLYFRGTPQERQWIYSTALAMSLAGKTVNVYTNKDGARCRIHNIQVTSDLN